MADQLLTAAMVHVFALAGLLAGIAPLWPISRACRAARNGLRWCWQKAVA
ncbi:hypothetical protein I5W36_16560 [Stenotrophomonas maltophilia]|nr:hypothetical protein [Stenotrophomonas maltophilia]MCM2995096.1 hypothetical protein [Stenotrophomonas maltophilia]